MESRKERFDMWGFFRVRSIDARRAAVKSEKSGALCGVRPDCYSRSAKEACWRFSPWYAFKLAFGR